MQNLTKTQNTIILVALENLLADYKNSRPELFKAQVAELVEIYNNIT